MSRRRRRRHRRVCPFARLPSQVLSLRPFAVAGSEFELMAKHNRARHIEKITEDGILCQIVSYLTLREAVRTSVLSSRWRHIWEYASKLIFDDKNVLGSRVIEVNESNRVIVNKFISFLDEFMKHHRGNGVEKFTIDFPLNKEHTHHLNKWVNFGVASGAKYFSLHLNKFYLPSTERYVFPHQYFACGRGSSINQLFLGYVDLILPSNFDGFSSLKAIDLEGVFVNGIQNLMRSCSALESMRITMNQNLVYLNISHPRLKYLKVGTCKSLEHIELSAENLTSFEYNGGAGIKFFFKKTPRLTDALFQFCYHSDPIHYVLSRLPADMPQIESLSLEAWKKFEVSDLALNSQKFIHLKQLVILVKGDAFHEFIWLANLLNAAPFMEKLLLHLGFVTKAGKMETIKHSNCPHQHLKTAEITGFAGFKRHREIARYLLNNAPRLELMTINASEQSIYLWHKWIVKSNPCNLRQVHDSVGLLRKEASSSTKFVLL